MKKILACSILLISLFLGCKKVDNSTGNTPISLIKKDKISGLVQKGPYINGTQIVMYVLDDKLAQTGKVFNTQITDNKGSFQLTNVELSSKFVQLAANGYYFNESSNAITIAQLQLNALTDVTDASTINVNILTHLEKRRVEYLFKSGKTFTEAKKTAQQEILAMFGISLTQSAVSEKLDIVNTGDANAVLLAVSLIIQGNLSVGDLSELLATISSDIEEDGVLNSETVKTTLIDNAKSLNLSAIRENLLTRYQKVAITAEIPDFEKYITNVFLKRTSEKPTIEIRPSTQFDNHSATVYGIINPNGAKTTVTFEYGLTNNYGKSVTADLLTPGTVLDDWTGVWVYSNLKNLDSSTTYHYRIKAENEKGITYSADSTFITLKDNISYIAPGTEVTIGTQVWMQKNLDVPKYRNGDLIPEVKDPTTWTNLKTGAWCYYNNDSAKYAAIYGRLYNWYAVNDPRGLAPLGWHIPSISEWDILANYLGGASVAGGKMNTMGTIESNTGLWFMPNTNATNSSGFYGQPSGYRYDNPADMGTSAFIWTSIEGSTENAQAALLFRDGGVLQNTWHDGQTGMSKRYGFAVRCLKD